MVVKLIFDSKNKFNNFKHILVRASSYILLSCFVFFLMSCDSGVVLYHDNIHEVSDVEKIELITYDSDENDIYNEMKTFDGNLLSIDNLLNDEEILSFISDLSNIQGIGGKYKHVTNQPHGQGVLITYIDGRFTIITSKTINDEDVIYIGEFKNDLSLDFYHSYIWSEGSDNFIDLLEEYF